MAKVVRLSASLPTNACGMIPVQLSRASCPGVTRASIKDIPGGAKTAALQANKYTRELQDRIREKLLSAEQLPSSYDTAWVAMVPAQGAPDQSPRFPRCVEWILQNQHGDGSWGLGHHDLSSLGKDAICSTLACILALKTWNVGDEHIRKGLRFIENNTSCITDEKCHTPVGFNVIFPGMLGFGIDMGLEFPLRQSDLDVIFRLRQLELQRFVVVGLNPGWPLSPMFWMATSGPVLSGCDDHDERSVRVCVIRNSPSCPDRVIARFEFVCFP